MEEILQLDRQLMLWMNYDGGTVADTFWWYVSQTWTWIPLYALLIMILIRHCSPVRTNWRQLVLLIVITALVVVFADQISSGIIKPLVERPRPARPDSGISDLIHTVRGYRGGHYGFVSSHAANTWGIALWFILLFRGWKKEGSFSSPLFIINFSLFIFSILNCYSRIYLGVHYPGDILGGLIVGTISALFCYYVLYKHGNNWLNQRKR